MNSKKRLAVFVALVASSLCSTLPSVAAASGMSVTSSAFSEGATVPRKYTGDGEDVSPPLSWTPTAQAKSYAISCEDPDAPAGTWWHWILFNIGPDTHQLGEGVPKVATMAKGVLQGSNDFHKPGYNGPAPPPGKVHHYIFKVMALDTMLALKADCGKEAFKRALKGHVLAEGQLTGVYKR